MTEEKFKAEIKELNDTYKKQIKKLESQLALQVQQHQLSSMEIHKLKKDLDQQKKSYEKSIRALSECNGSGREQQLQQHIQELTLNFQKEREELMLEIAEFRENKQFYRSLRMQNQRLNGELGSLKLDFKELQNNYRDLLSQKEEISEGFERKLKDLQFSKAEALRSQKDYLESRFSTLQNQFQNYKQEHSSMSSMIGQRNQEELIKMKTHYELERQRQEHELKNVRDNADKQIQQLNKYYQGRLKDDVQAKEVQLVQLKIQINRSRQLFKESLNNAENQANLRYQKLNNQFMNSKIQLSKENALLGQENQFLKKQLSELGQQRDSTVTRYEEKCLKLKEEMELKVKEKMLFNQEQRQSLQEKLNRTESLLKQKQSKLILQFSGKQKQVSLLKEKLANLQLKRSEAQGRLSQQIRVLQENASRFEESGLLRENASKRQNQLLKRKIIQLEEHISGLSINHESQISLLHQQINFHKRQKEVVDEDMSQFVKNFQLTVSKVNESKEKNFMKCKQEHNQIVMALTEKYQNQKRHLQQVTSHKIKTLEELNFKLAKENKVYKERLMDDSSKFNERKYQDLLEKERQARTENEFLRDQRGRSTTYQVQVYRSRIIELQNCLKKTKEERDSLISQRQNDSVLQESQSRRNTHYSMVGPSNVSNFSVSYLGSMKKRDRFGDQSLVGGSRFE